MIGNDIVDLALSRKESNWQRQGFLQKIFTLKEQSLIQNSENKELLIWNLWTRKEASYKIFVQESEIKGYFPQKIECFYSSELIGNVSIGEKVYHTKTIITEEFIHTIAIKNHLDFDSVLVMKNRDSIIKIDGIPKYFDKQSGNYISVSISNHGRFEKIVMLTNITSPIGV